MVYTPNLMKVCLLAQSYSRVVNIWTDIIPTTPDKKIKNRTTVVFKIVKFVTMLHWYEYHVFWHYPNVQYLCIVSITFYTLLPTTLIQRDFLRRSN